MNQTIEQVEQLRQRAIAMLLEAREEINGKLEQLGWENGEPPTNGKRRGRPPKQKAPDESGAEVEQAQAATHEA